jgi:hypothetical protein
MSALRNKDNQFFIICIKCPTPREGTPGTGETSETLYPLIMPNYN